jgi:hypothetical protein
MTACVFCGRTAGDDKAPCDACRGVQMEPDWDAIGNELGMTDGPDAAHVATTDLW